MLHLLSPSRAATADYLRVGVPVSIKFRPLRLDRALAEVGVLHHTSAELAELSILGPTNRPAFAGAKVVSVIERLARSALIAEPRLGNTYPVVDKRRYLRKLHVRFGAPKLDDLRF
jgi:hypothetical protein